MLRRSAETAKVHHPLVSASGNPRTLVPSELLQERWGYLSAGTSRWDLPHFGSSTHSPSVKWRTRECVVPWPCPPPFRGATGRKIVS